MKRFLMAAPALLFSANSALAFNFGFVRAPDWMDSWLIWLIVAGTPFWLFIFALNAKGSGQGVLFDPNIKGPAKAVALAGAFLFVVTMGFVFVGMGLARYHEAV